MKWSLFKENIAIYVLLFLFWLLLSRTVSFQSVIVGLLVSSSVLIFCKEMHINKNETSFTSFKKIIYFFYFIIRLIIKIAKANFEVAMIVLNPTLPIEPVFIEVPMNINKTLNKVILANSITLTPGTLTVDVKDDYIIIHALTQKSCSEAENDILNRTVESFEEN